MTSICPDCGEDVCRCDVARDMRAFEEHRPPSPSMGQAAKDRFAAAHAKAREANPAPIDMVIVQGHPDYGVTPAGEVWRLTATGNNHRVPRRINWLHMGTPTTSPHVRFYDGGSPTVRSIARLLRDHFPQNA